MSEICNPCTTSALETQLLALDLQSMEIETNRVEKIVHDQACQIKKQEETICKLQACLDECKATNKIITERFRVNLGKLKGIRAVCP